METSSRRKSFLINVIIVVVAFACALLLAEWVLRLLAPTPILEDPILGNVMQPGGEYDANGFRNAYALEHPTLIAIGDSQTQGNNATREEAWPQVLGVLSTTSIYQMALGGYGPVQYDYLVDRAIALKPKMTMAAFYLGNDLTDAYRIAYDYDHWKDLRDPDFMVPVATSSVSASSTEGIDYRTLLQTGLPPDSLQFKIYQIRLWVRAHSLLYAKLGDATRALRERVGVAKTKNEKLADIAEYSSLHPDLIYTVIEPGIETILSPGYRLDTVSLDRAQTAEGWRIAQDRFRDMGEKLHAAQIRFLLVVIPTKEKVYLEHMRHETGKIPDVFALYDKKESEVEEKTRAFCQAEHIDCVFVLPAMAAALDRGEALYGVTMDGHPTSRGYRVIANAILEAQVLK